MMHGSGMFFPLIGSLVLIGIPAAIILGKAGYSKLWVIVAFIPMVNLIALWIFAFAKWPALRR
ncbi:hypothetical protein [Castellaniella sp. GW247-6E4]|uniref:hypothetical protein n=1 Tax=Castellaniella sp. GW247-6E4 TaxID=3140380 RepID=UPI00331578A1